MSVISPPHKEKDALSRERISEGEIGVQKARNGKVGRKAFKSREIVGLNGGRTNLMRFN